jgi:hypothetical protein
MVMVLYIGKPGLAQGQQPNDSVNKPPGTAIQGSPEKPTPATEELEAKFKATLTKATLAGYWCSIKDGTLGPAKDDQYTINSVLKVGGEMWLINARIRYAQKDFVALIPVRVKWAGDTPVITESLYHISGPHPLTLDSGGIDEGLSDLDKST